MILSSLRRATGVAVLAAVAGLLATPSLPAQAATKAPTTLSIRVARPVVEPGGADRVSGHLGLAGALSAAGRTVTLEARPAGSAEFVPVAEVTAGERGSVSVEVAPEVTTRYRWRYAGADDARGSVSGVAGVRVREGAHPPRRLATSLSIRAVQRVGPKGTVDRVRGVLRARRGALPRRPVLLLSKTADDSAWTLAGVHRTRRHGIVRFRVDPDQHTGYRLVFLGTRLLMPARSGIVRIPVRPDVVLAADPTTIAPGGSTTVSGLVSVHGVPLSGATVRLWAVRVGHPHSAGVIARSVTGDDGSVAFPTTPAASTTYRLRVVAGDSAAGTVSGPVTVRVVAPTS